jgi:cytochrome P450
MFNARGAPPRSLSLGGASPTRFPPAPHSGRRRLRYYRKVIGSAWRDPLGFLSRVSAEHGDIAHFSFTRIPVYVLNDPADIEQVLVTHHDRFVKGWSLKGARRLFGDGLLTSDGDLHTRHRRAVQPAFQRERLTELVGEAITLAERQSDGWRSGQMLDITAEMSRLTLALAARTLVGSDGDVLAAAAHDAITEAVDYLEVPALPFAVALDLLRPMRLRRFRAARRRLDELLEDIVARRGAHERGDVLTLLRSAGISGRQLRDELITLLLAGHDTMGHALAWTWLFVACDAPIGVRLRAEVDANVGSRALNPDDVPVLLFTKAIFAESLRLYPPAWLLGRVVVKAHRAGSYDIPRGSLVIVSPWVVHRRERWFSEPLRFNPDRWSDKARSERPRFAYFPFGGGPRGCMGEMLAWAQGVAILATIARQWDLQAVDTVLPPPHPGLTLRPATPSYLRAMKR